MKIMKTVLMWAGIVFAALIIIPIVWYQVWAGLNPEEAAVIDANARNNIAIQDSIAKVEEAKKPRKLTKAEIEQRRNNGIQYLIQENPNSIIKAVADPEGVAHIYVENNGSRRDGLAESLCYDVKDSLIKEVWIFDYATFGDGIPKMIGKSACDKFD